MFKRMMYPMAFATLAAAVQVSALEAISDREMSEINGQAFIKVDATSYNQGTGDWAGQYEFTKVNLGLDIETLTTADTLKVGEFERTAYQDGTVPVLNDDRTIIYDANGNPVVHEADIIINDFALGRVENYRNAAEATIDPFMIRDPYIELAYKVEDGVRRVAGVRIGFAQAQGWLSGEIVSLTGRFQGEIRGLVATVYEQNCDSWLDGFNCLELSLAQSTEIYTQIDLLDASNGSGTAGNGEAYLKRASWAGVPNGRSFESDDSGLIASLIPILTVADDCEVTGTPACFRTTIYQSIYVGQEGVGFEEGGAASGAFLSLQTEAVPWEDLSGLDSADRVLTERGAYLNMAQYAGPGGGEDVRYPLYLDLYTATNGQERVATCVGQLKGC